MLWEDNYLMHYGIKGQRWGIRRFQNKDGTLTEEGKKRYTDSEKRNTTKSEGDFITSAYKASADKGLMKKLGKILGNSNDPEVKKTASLAERFKETERKLNEKFLEYNDKYTKDTGKYWDGDAGELHSYLTEHYKEYGGLANEHELLSAKFSKACMKLSKNEEIRSIPEFNKYTDLRFVNNSGDVKTGSTAAYAIASSLLKNQAESYGFIPDVYFVEWHDSKGQPYPTWIDNVIKELDH